MSEPKFIESFDITDWEIETDSGWQPVSHVHKTVEYVEWIIETQAGKSLVCADFHILFDERMEEVFARDLVPYTSRIQTKEGTELVVRVEETTRSSHMYDISVDSEDHRFFSNDILSHNSTIVAAYIAWFVLFNENKTAVILANKQAIATEIFSRVAFIVENLPHWLQQGVEEWNKRSFSLENGSRLISAATSPSAVRGMSCNLLLLDEFAHLPPKLADEFMASVFPTISSGKSSKLIIVSTPNGLNHFYKLWADAENDVNGFTPVEGRWQENPLRSEEWAEDQKKKLGEVKYRQEIECSFEGSSYTLVDGKKLAAIPAKKPIFEKSNLEIFQAPQEGKNYIMTVDVSRGRHLDYSAFSVIDITQTPYEVVATFKDNTVSSIDFPHIIFNTAMQFNKAFLLIEINDIGGEVANTLLMDYEYDNIYYTNSSGITAAKGYPGIRTTKKVKSIGCNTLKELVEKDQLVINSFKILQELSVFVQKRGSYGADDTIINDDLCTTLWLFAWLTRQQTFKDITDQNIVEILARQRQEYIDESMTPFGFYDDGSASQNYSPIAPINDGWD